MRNKKKTGIEKLKMYSIQNNINLIKKSALSLRQIIKVYQFIDGTNKDGQNRQKNVSL